MQHLQGGCKQVGEGRPPCDTESVLGGALQASKDEGTPPCPALDSPVPPPTTLLPSHLSAQVDMG